MGECVIVCLCVARTAGSSPVCYFSKTAMHATAQHVKQVLATVQPLLLVSESANWGWVPCWPGGSMASNKRPDDSQYTVVVMQLPPTYVEDP